MAKSVSVPDVFPLLLPTDAAFKEYEGFITLNGKEEPFRISTPSITVPGSIKCSETLVRILEGHEKLVFERMTHCRDLASFLAEFKELLERLYSVKRAGLPGLGVGLGLDFPPSAFYRSVVQELEAVGFENLVKANQTLTELELALVDAKGRQHLLGLKLALDYPFTAPVCSIALPHAYELRWSVPGSGSGSGSAACTLADVVAQYRSVFREYQGLWDQLDEMDAKTWILEPENPTRDCTMRRVAVAKHCSILLELDPRAPYAYPDCRLMGADHAVKGLRAALHANSAKWNQRKSLKDNLEATLEITLPFPEASKMDEYSGECGICYAYRLDSAIPECVCENVSCSRPYHRQCLVEWLRALPETRRSFDTLFGECPYCSQPLTVRGRE